MMIEYALTAITLQQIQVFLSLSKTLSFTKTAVELNVTQPSVSQSLSTLENILGYKLLRRNKREVSLTEEGDALRRHWENVLPAVQKGHHEAGRIADMEKEELNIGVAYTTDIDKYFWPLAQRYKIRHPDVKMSVVEDEITLLMTNLSNGQADLIFVPDFEAYRLDKSTYSWQYAVKSNVQIIVPATSDLSRRKSLRFEDIQDKPIAICDPERNPNPLRWVHDLYKAHGGVPLIGCYYKSNYQIRDSIVAKDCIFITDDSWNYTPDTGSKRIPLEGHENGLICIWAKREKKRSVADFIALLQD